MPFPRRPMSPGLGGLIGGTLGGGLMLLDYVGIDPLDDGFWFPQTYKKPVFTPTAGTWEEIVCASATGPYNTTSYLSSTCNTIVGGNCLTGQCCASSNAQNRWATFGQAIRPDLRKFQIAEGYKAGVAWYNRNQILWRKNPNPCGELGGGRLQIPIAFQPGAPARDPEPNPNTVKRLPPTNQPWQRPAPPVVNPWQRVSVEPQPGGRSRFGNPPPPTPRAPPRPGEKERKTLSRSKRFAVAVFRALDTISESAEIINALYEALPLETRKRWEKGRDPRGLIDNAGQYGLGGADWKAEALWHNWHLLDTVKAVENIAKNQVEDRLYGEIYKHIPRHLGGV